MPSRAVRLEIDVPRPAVSLTVALVALNFDVQAIAYPAGKGDPFILFSKMQPASAPNEVI